MTRILSDQLWKSTFTSTTVHCARCHDHKFDAISTKDYYALAGYLLGCGSGFLVALLVDRVPFLQRGLLPLGNFVSALPIVGVAPIMVMWFGFDWQSKAAVVVIMTFFPMLVNTIAGLHATAAMERDLMRSYAANYWQTLLSVRLPNALPFIFAGLNVSRTVPSGRIRTRRSTHSDPGEARSPSRTSRITVE